MGTIASHTIEERRQQEQIHLDSLKTAPERNKLGQFATPPELALSLARYAHELMGKTPVVFLDPAIGTGSFFSAASQAFGENITAATGIELDPLRHTVTRDGRPVDLSVKEFGVLEALLRARPAFLSAEALLERAWDEHADPFTNTVTVTIGRLRRKLGDPPVITTTPGVGYRIAGPEPPAG